MITEPLSNAQKLELLAIWEKACNDAFDHMRKPGNLDQCCWDVLAIARKRINAEQFRLRCAAD